MRKSNLGNLIILALVFLNIIVWIVFPPINDGSDTFLRKYAGEIIGATNIVLMSIALVLSARPKWAEPFFGGLDKMYVAHRRVATTVLLLIFAHVLVIPISLHWRLGNYLAVIAFAGIVSIALVSLAPRIPFLNKLTGGTYEGWKNLKRFIGIFFILGFIHALTVDALSALIAFSWTQVFFIIGAAAYLYTEIFGRFFKKYLPYSVDAVNHPNNSTTEVVLRAKSETRLPHARAGQFLFVRFPSDRKLDEAHPFTISSHPGADLVRITVKACGDFTRDLFAKLKPGMDAILEGPYGMFDYKSGGQKQIWIAGGIGLTPFLSFIRDMDGSLDRDVDFYYNVRHPEESLFVDEINFAAQKNPRLKPHIRHSSKDGSLTIEHILADVGGDPSTGSGQALKSHHVYLCGPLAMTQAFESKFLALGVPHEHIHYEEFNFR